MEVPKRVARMNVPKIRRERGHVPLHRVAPRHAALERAHGEGVAQIVESGPPAGGRVRPDSGTKADRPECPPDHGVPNRASTSLTDEDVIGPADRARHADRIVLDGTELAMLLGGFEVGRAARIDAWEPKKQLKSDRGGLSGQNFR
jgi:hypothetical protein